MKILKRMIITVLSVLTAGCSVLPAGRMHSDDVIRIGMECTYAPYNWMEDTATDTNIGVDNAAGFYAEGYDVQIAKIICESLGKEAVIEKLVWEDLEPALNDGRIDLIIAGMVDTEERKDKILFSDTYDAEETQYGVLVYKGSEYETAESIQDFAGAVLIGQKGTRYDEVIDQIEGVKHLTPTKSVPAMIDRLLNRTCDGVIADEMVSAGYLEKYSRQLTFVSFEEGKGFDIGFTGSCVGMRKEDTELCEEINEILAGITAEKRKQIRDEAFAKMPK